MGLFGRQSVHIPSTSASSIILAPASSSTLRCDDSAEDEQIIHGLLPVPFWKFFRSLQFGDRRRCESRIIGRGRWYLSSAGERGGRWRANAQRYDVSTVRSYCTDRRYWTYCSAEDRRSEQFRSQLGWHHA